MPSIVEAVISQLPTLETDYNRVIREPAKLLAGKEEQLRGEGGFIHPFTPQHVLQGRSLATVDGARATRQLSGSADLMVLGASMGEGVRSADVYGTEPLSEGWARIVPHDSDNEMNLAGNIMAALELRLLAQVKADHVLIDGAYLGNASSVVFGLLSMKPRQVSFLTELNHDSMLQQGLFAVLSASQGGSRDLLKYIAVTKSDSSYVQSKQLFGHDLGSGIPDRVVASHFLRPGEFMHPRPVEPTPPLLRDLESKLGAAKPEVRSMLGGVLGWVKDFGGSWDPTMPNRLYTAYFKPSRWSYIDRALKVEFVYHEDSPRTLLEHTADVVTVVDDDMVESGIMEPYSNYIADVNAKQVSQAMEIVENALQGLASTAEEATSILRSYRT